MEQPSLKDVGKMVKLNNFQSRHVIMTIKAPNGSICRIYESDPDHMESKCEVVRTFMETNNE